MEEKYIEANLGKEQTPLEPEACKVQGFRIETIQSKDGKEISPKLVLECSHPKAGTIELSAVKYAKGDKLKTAGLWMKLDVDENLVNPSAVASMLKYYGVGRIVELKDKLISTIKDDNGYLIVKAY